MHVDMRALEEVMKSGLNRASAFLGYGIKTTDAAPLVSLSLDAAVRLQILPEPLSGEQAIYYRNEFRKWVIGQGLIELDQTYHRFLSAAIDTHEDLSLFRRGESLPDVHKRRRENTATLHDEFNTITGVNAPNENTFAGHLRSLGHARNCLAHDSGIVTQWRIKDSNGRTFVIGDTMIVRWIGSQMFQIKDGMKTPVEREHGFFVRADDVGSQLIVEDVLRERIYGDGDHVDFNPHDLAEIIWFYQKLAMHAAGRLYKYLEECRTEINARARPAST